MKILYYSPHPHLNLKSLSGYGTHMREMIGAFEKKGCEVLPVIMGGTTLEKETKDNDRRTELNTLKKILGKKLWRTLKDLQLIRFDKKAEKRLEEKVKNIMPDFIYERANYLQLSGVNVAQKMNIPHVLEVNGPYVDETEFLSGCKSYINWLVRKREKLQLEKTEHIVTVSSALKNYFIENYGIDRSKYLTLPNGFNQESISLDEQNQEELKKKHDLKGKKVIGFVGSIFEWHRIDLLIKAFDLLSDNNTKLLIVGFGEYVSKLRKIAEKCRRSSDIIFTGKVSKDEVFDYIQVMDICTAPGAAWYQSPIKLFEYGAMGKPIIAPDTEPVNEVMTNRQEGLLVKPDIEDIKSSLEFMLKEKEKAEKMGENFQEKVLTQFRWDRNAEKVLNVVNLNSG